MTTTSDSNVSIEPLLKWPGGKRWLVKTVQDLLPCCWNTYYEPFFGGGALFFSLENTEAVINDVNSELMECYQTVAKAPTKVINELSKLKNNDLAYRDVRADVPNTQAARAARLIYLCKLSFNGIYRVNRQGKFNVPYGRRSHMVVYDVDHIKSTSRKLARSRILTGDFAQSTEAAKDGDLVFLDPPYTVTHDTNGFLKYNKTLFSWEDQERLARVADELRQRGCFVIVSNAAHSCIAPLYPAFDRKLVPRHSTLAASSACRKPVSECLYIGYRLEASGVAKICDGDRQDTLTNEP